MELGTKTKIYVCAYLSQTCILIISSLYLKMIVINDSWHTDMTIIHNIISQYELHHYIAIVIVRSSVFLKGGRGGG